jgi:hypothetical protein
MGQRRGPQGTEIADKVARLFGTHFQLSRGSEIFYPRKESGEKVPFSPTARAGMIVAVLLAFC